MNGIYIDYKLMPDSIIESIDKTLLDLQLKQKREKLEKYNLFIDKAFLHVAAFLNYRSHSKPFRIYYKSLIENDIPYFMMSLRNNPDALLNAGYYNTKNYYKFNIEVIDIGDGDFTFILTITDPSSDTIETYSRTLGRFD